MTKVARQLELPGTEPKRPWGGARVGAGRKRQKGSRASVPHRARPAHRARHPVHVTLRARRGLPSFREQAIFIAMRAAITDALRSARIGASFRVVHFSVQSDHVHLIVEAHDKRAMARGMLGLNVRLARSINGVLGVRGQVWGERYHGHALRTPRQVRNAIVYVLMNAKKHGVRLSGIDPLSSAPWFDGFAGITARTDERPVAATRTWLGGTGWRRRGLIRLEEHPRS
jgi:putative transposase